MVVKTALAGCSPAAVFTVPVVLLLLSFHWSCVQSACLSSCPSNACSSRHNRNAGYCASANYVRTTSRQSYQGSESYQDYYSRKCGFWRLGRCRESQIQYRSVTRYRTIHHSTLRCTTYCCRGYSGSGTNCRPVCTRSCRNGGTCSAPYTCTCTSRWTGSTCTIPVCTRSCRNGGTCSAPNTCTCTSRWTGSTCTIPVCRPGCYNRGTCTAPGRCSCTPQWTGPTCTTDVNECIAGTHNCQQRCTNTRGGFTCSCNSGYRLLGNGYRCQAVCTRTCWNGGTCSAPNTCTCTSRWTGSTCTIPVCSPSCSNRGTCTAPSRCSCTPQWTGPTCTTDVDECTDGTDNCEQQCTNTPGGFTCSCNSGYQLLGNGYQCQAPPSSVRISGSSRIRYTNRLSLTCNASGIVDDYKWYRNRDKLTTNTSRYYKSSAQLSDGGSYRCKACNWAGCTKSSSYTVIVIDVPDAVNVSSIEVTNTTFDTISIQWTPPNNNSDSIIDYRVYLYGSGGLVFTPSQPMVTLESLQPFTTYQIRISARNNVGRGGNSSERNVNTLTRDEVLVSNITYSTPRVGVSSCTVELKWVVPEECLTDKLEGYRLSRWPTNIANVETTTVNRDNVSCAWNVTAIGSETYCHEWEGFSPGSQYTVSLEIVYNYSILSFGGPTNVTITIPTLPPSQEEVETAVLAVGVAVGVLLAVLVTAVVLIVVLLICKGCRCRKTKDTDTAVVYNVNKDVSGNPMEAVQFEPAYGGDNYTLTDDHQYVNKNPHCVSEDCVTSQKQRYASLDLKSVLTSAYASLAFKRDSSTAISKYGDNTNTTSKYDTPKKVVPQKKPSTQQTDEYANWNVISQQHGEGDQSSVDRKSSNKIPSTSGPGVKEVGKEATAPQKSQVFASDVTMPNNKEDINDTQHLTLSKKHEQREKVPPPTKPRPNTNKKQPLLPPTQESATTKPQTHPQQPNPVVTDSSRDAPPIPPKAKKQPLLPKKVSPEQSAVTKQPLSGSNVTELRKKLEKKYSVN